MYGLSPHELRILRALRTPRKIQDFLDTLPVNFENHGITCMSPRRVLRERVAHCMEGAMLAALALRLAGHKPLVMDLKCTSDDTDHVVALFRYGNHWGAISKTNHGTLRFRDPVYRTVRELAMSFFHEYTEPKGKKVMRSYSRPVDLSRFDALDWVTDEEELFYIPAYIDDARHYDILTRSQLAILRRADPLERKLGSLLEWESEEKRTVDA